jgi:hypothetical protein
VTDWLLLKECHVMNLTFRLARKRRSDADCAILYADAEGPIESEMTDCSCYKIWTGLDQAIARSFCLTNGILYSISFLQKQMRNVHGCIQEDYKSGTGLGGNNFSHAALKVSADRPLPALTSLVKELPLLRVEQRR